MRYAAPTAPTYGRPSWLVTLYLVIGAIVAATHNYWSQLHTLRGWGSALLGTVLWPLILFGVSLHIH
jgi:hypothetical protein